MNRIECNLLVAGFVIPLFGVMIAVFRYLNKRGGSKKKVIQRAVIWTLVLAAIACFICFLVTPPSLSVSIMLQDSALSQNDTTQVVCGLGGIDYPSSVFLPFCVANKGTLTIEDLTLTIQYEGDYIRLRPDSLMVKSILGGLKEYSQRETSSHENLFMSTIHVNAVNPGQIIQLFEPFVWTSSYLPWLERKRCPCVNVIVEVSAKNLERKLFSIVMFAVPATSFSELSSNLGKYSSFCRRSSKMIGIVAPLELEDLVDGKTYTCEGIQVRAASFYR